MFVYILSSLFPFSSSLQLQICASLMISVCEKEEEKKEELTGTSWAEWLRILSQLIKNTFVKGRGERGERERKKEERERGRKRREREEERGERERGRKRRERGRVGSSTNDIQYMKV